MPDLSGYSLESAAKLLDSLGITYSYEGSGSVIKQSVPKEK